MTDSQNITNSAQDAGQMQLIDIYATGGTGFCVVLIENYDPSQQAGSQEGVFLGNTEFGEIDEDGQYDGDDDEIIEHVRAEFDLDEEIPCKVR